MTLQFRGLFEPHEIMTGDRRAFRSMGLTNRDLPLPLMLRSSSGGHSGAEVIGEITKIENGPKGRWYSGNFLDPKIIPKVTEAIYLAKKRIIGPSVDLDRSFTVEPRLHADGKPMAYFTAGNVIGVTLVPMPAFADVTFEITSSDVAGDTKSLQASGAESTWAKGPLPASWMLSAIEGDFAVSQANWDGLPVAPRDYKFDADDAVKRIAQWSGVGTPNADVSKYASMFLWRGGNQTGDTLAQEDFRMPIGDVINGQPHLVFHAIYAAAALISGAHGGLPNVPDEEKNAIKGVINQIYPKMAKAFGDDTMHSPFVAGDGGQQQMSQPTEEFVLAAEALQEYGELTEDTFATAPYGDVAYADPGYREGKKRYPLDSEAHCRAAWAFINMPDNAAPYTPEQLAHVRGQIIAALKKYGVNVSEKADTKASAPPMKTGEMSVDSEDLQELGEFAVGSVGAPRPSLKAFENPHLSVATPLTVTDDGRVFGHLGKWGECHLGIGDKCTVLPKSRTDYQLFRSGTVRTAEGADIRVGKITLGTGHAHPTYGIVPSREHYDNSGWCAAVVNVGEDSHGVWVSGVLTDPSKADELRRSPLSGDWRRYNGNLELVAALAVNNPGFPVFHVQESEEFSLCAAGIVEHPAMDSMTELVDEPPQSLYTIIDYDDVVAEVTATLTASRERTERLEAIRATADRHLQSQRARRFAAITGEEITPSATPTATPAGKVAPEKGKSAASNGSPSGEVVEDPDADPSTPGIAESDDPGRATLMDRMRSGRYVVIEEPDDSEAATQKPQSPAA